MQAEMDIFVLMFLYFPKKLEEINEICGKIYNLYPSKIEGVEKSDVSVKSGHIEQIDHQNHSINSKNEQDITFAKRKLLRVVQRISQKSRFG
jgi:hypothetical protein